MLNTIIIPADLSNHYDNSLNSALLYEQITPLDIVLSFRDDIDKDKIETKFNEIHNRVARKLKFSETTVRYVTGSDLEKFNCGEIAPTGNDTLILLQCFKDIEGESNTYSVDYTVKMIRGCRQNFMVIPDEWSKETVNKIIFPVHILTKVRHKVTFTSVIAKMFNAEVYVVTLQTTNQKEIVKRLNLYSLQVINHLKNYGLTTHFETLEGKKIPEMTFDYASSISADLISIIPEDIKGPRFFSKGYLHEMIEKSSFPLIVAAPRKAKISGSFSASAG